jgi:hypothetical protein
MCLSVGGASGASDDKFDFIAAGLNDEAEKHKVSMV